MTMTQPDIKLTKKSVNSKTVAAVVDTIVRLSVDDYGDSLWSDVHRDWFIDRIESGLAILEENKKITQWDVIGDNRNNKLVDAEAGRFNLTVKYKQTNCLNITQLIYEIKTRPR